MFGHPSAGALLVPDHGVDALADLLDRALRARGYVPAARPLPAGYVPARGEWLAFVVAEAEEPPVGVALLESLDMVFDVARWLSEEIPETPLAAYRRYLGTNPVMKYLTGGVPRWKDGEDADLEVGWPVPYEPPAGFLRAEDVGLPANAGDAAGDLYPALRAYAEAVAHPVPGERQLAWIKASSPLAP